MVMNAGRVAVFDWCASAARHWHPFEVTKWRQLASCCLSRRMPEKVRVEVTRDDLSGDRLGRVAAPGRGDTFLAKGPDSGRWPTMLHGRLHAGSGNRFPTDSGDGLERRMTAVCSRPTTGVAAIADPWISSRLLPPPKTKGASTYLVSSGEAEEREFPRRWMPCLPRPSRNVIGQLGQEQFLVGIGLGTAG